MRTRRIIFAFICFCLVAFLCCPEMETFQGHTGEVTEVLPSPDGKTLASISRYHEEYYRNSDKTIRLWDIATRKERAVIRAHEGKFSGTVFSPDSKILVSKGSGDGTIKLWDVASGKEMATVQDVPEKLADGVALSPDGSILATASSGGTIKLWKVTSGEQKMILTGHARPVCALVFSPDGETIASGSYDHTVKIWDVATGKERATLKGYTFPVLNLAFSPDGNTLAAADVAGRSTVRLWNVATGEEGNFEIPSWFDDSTTDNIRYLVFSPDSKTLAFGCDEIIGLCDVTSGKNIANFGKGQQSHFPLMDREFYGLRINSKTQICSVFFTPEGKLMGVGCRKNIVTLWQVTSVNIEKK